MYPDSWLTVPHSLPSTAPAFSPSHVSLTTPVAFPVPWQPLHQFSILGHVRILRQPFYRSHQPWSSGNGSHIIICCKINISGRGSPAVTAYAISVDHGFDGLGIGYINRVATDGITSVVQRSLQDPFSIAAIWSGFNGGSGGGGGVGGSGMISSAWCLHATTAITRSMNERYRILVSN